MSTVALIAEVQTLLARVSDLLVIPPKPADGLHLSARDCNELIDRLGLGATQSAERLIAAIDRLASVRIGDIRIPFTPGQVAELQHRAAKRGRSVEMELRAVVSRIEDELFYKGG